MQIPSRYLKTASFSGYSRCGACSNFNRSSRGCPLFLIVNCSLKYQMFTTKIKKKYTHYNILLFTEVLKWTQSDNDSSRRRLGNLWLISDIISMYPHLKIGQYLIIKKQNASRLLIHVTYRVSLVYYFVNIKHKIISQAARNHPQKS